MRHEEVTYKFFSKLGQYTLQYEPLNWKDDEKKLLRSSKYFGVYTELSNNLEFVKDAAKYLENAYEQFGTEFEIKLYRYVKRDAFKLPELDYVGYLDLKTYSKEGLKVKVKFLTGGLQSLMESQYDEDFELERTTDIQGNVIPALNYQNINITGRQILLESLSETSSNNSNLVLFTFGDFGFLEVFRSVPLTMVYESDDDFSGQIPAISPLTLDQFQANDFFYLSTKQGNRDRDIQYSFKVQSITGELYSFVILEVYIGKWQIENDGTFTHISSALIRSLDSRDDLTVGNTYSGTSTTASIEEENIARSVYFKVFAQTPNQGVKQINVELSNIDFSVKQTEDSNFESTNAKTLRTFDAANRLVQIYTGKNTKFQSSLFGGVQDGYQNNGKWERTAITSGTHLRNLPEAKITTSFKDIFELNNYFNLGWGVERINGAEKVVIEEKSYFFQNKVFVDLGEIDDLKISCAPEYLYKSMTFGNNKAGQYEEVRGLQEYNAKTTYSSYLTTADNSYDVTGQIRADLVGMEYARRKQYDNAPFEDSEYDKENWIFHLDPNQNILRKWQTDFSEKPIVYSPETAGNLLLTPFRSMERHSDWFLAGLTQNLDKKTRYKNGTGDVNVATKKTGDVLRYENGNIPNNQLKKPIFKAEYLEFKYPVNYTVRKKIFGTSVVNNKDIPNTNLLVQFTWKNSKYYGWIVDLDLNGEGNWKLLRRA